MGRGAGRKGKPEEKHHQLNNSNLYFITLGSISFYTRYNSTQNCVTTLCWLDVFRKFHDTICGIVSPRITSVVERVTLKMFLVVFTWCPGKDTSNHMGIWKKCTRKASKGKQIGGQKRVERLVLELAMKSVPQFPTNPGRIGELQICGL